MKEVRHRKSKDERKKGWVKIDEDEEWKVGSESSSTLVSSLLAFRVYHPCLFSAAAAAVHKLPHNHSSANAVRFARWPILSNIMKCTLLSSQFLSNRNLSLISHTHAHAHAHVRITIARLCILSNCDGVACIFFLYYLHSTQYCRNMSEIFPIATEIFSQHFLQMLQNISSQHYNFNFLKYF